MVGLPPRTVTGSVLRDDYVLVLAHEHLVIDIACWLDTAHPLYAELGGLTVSPLTVPDVRRHPFACRDNLLLCDETVAVDELARPAECTPMLIVDVTPDTARPDPEMLVRISRRSNVDIVRGCGPYIEASWSGVPRSRDQVRQSIIDSFHAEFPASVIGEIGTSAVITAGEREALLGATDAQVVLDAPLYVHVDPWEPAAFEALTEVAAAGGDVSRTVICHMDLKAVHDRDYVTELLQRGALVAIDIWGDEDAYGGRPMPSDEQRAEAVARLIDAGWGSRIVHSQDVCTKTQLRRHGGPGYLHLWDRARGLLRAQGLSDAELHAQLAGNALALLGVSVPSS